MQGSGGQCSRTRLTGLGHFHFLAKQQMHLATAKNLDDAVDGKSASKRFFFVGTLMTIHSYEYDQNCWLGHFLYFLFSMETFTFSLNI